MHAKNGGSLCRELIQAGEVRIAVHTSPTDRNSALLVSGFLVHSTAFVLSLLPASRDKRQEQCLSLYLWSDPFLFHPQMTFTVDWAYNSR